MGDTLRILVLADSHLGFDLPLRPRVKRRRRGAEFLANHAVALEPALAGEVDLVVHGGDVFHRPRVPASLAYQAYEPLRRVADRGVPVILVPGNHERSRLPHRGLLAHPQVHVFEGPRTFVVEVAGGPRVAVAGFPYERRGVRERFPELLERTGWRTVEAGVRLLCVHHCVEGATVGPGDHVFDRAPDVIRGRDIPPGLAAVLSGHIHRHQVLTADLGGRQLAAPVLYPGSVERTSTAERDEIKGFLVVEISLEQGPPGAAGAGRSAMSRVAGDLRWHFRRLPARPMLVRELAAAGMTAGALASAVRATIAAAPADAVLQIRIRGEPRGGAASLTAASLRSIAPGTMNVELRMADGSSLSPRRPGRRRRSPVQGSPDPNFRLGL